MAIPGTGRAGVCSACGSDVLDGGQSGAYCSNNACSNGWGGTPVESLPKVNDVFMVSIPADTTDKADLEALLREAFPAARVIHSS